MAVAVSLSEILAAIQNAALESQKLTEQQLQRQRERYFKDDGTPHCLAIKVPDNRPEGTPGGWREVAVPLFALVQPTALRMKDLNVEFDAYAVGLHDEDPSSQPNLQILLGEPGDIDSTPVNVKVKLDGISSTISVKDMQVSVTPGVRA